MARHLRLAQPIQNKLVRLDAAAAIIRHISQVHVDELVEEVRNVPIAPWRSIHIASDSSGSADDIHSQADCSADLACDLMHSGARNRGFAGLLRHPRPQRQTRRRNPITTATL